MAGGGLLGMITRSWAREGLVGGDFREGCGGGVDGRAMELSWSSGVGTTSAPLIGSTMLPSAGVGGTGGSGQLGSGFGGGIKICEFLHGVAELGDPTPLNRFTFDDPSDSVLAFAWRDGAVVQGTTSGMSTVSPVSGPKKPF